MECPRAVEWHGFMITRNCLHPRHRKRLATAPSGGCIDISSLSEVSRVRIHLHVMGKDLAGQEFCFHPPSPSSPSVCPLFGSVFQSDLRVTATSSLTTFSVTNRFISSSIIFLPDSSLSFLSTRAFFFLFYFLQLVKFTSLQLCLSTMKTILRSLLSQK